MRTTACEPGDSPAPTGHGLAQALASQGVALPDGSGLAFGTAAAAQAYADQRVALLQVSHAAMATEFAALVWVSDKGLAMDAAAAGWELLGPLEQELSAYRSSSGLSALNRAAQSVASGISDHLSEILDLAAAVYAWSGGAYDITARPLGRLWQQARQEGRFPTAEERQAATSRVGWDKVEWNYPAKQLRFTVPGMELDLGSIGKGYALDVCARLMQDKGLSRAILHGGQSSILAWSDCRAAAVVNSDVNTGATLSQAPAAAATVRPWEISIGHPLRPGESLARVWLSSGAAGTSGSARQFYYLGGKRMCHVLDPRTGWPVEGVLAVTVLAPTAALADALSTACFVLGPTEAARLTAPYPDLAALFVVPASGKSGVELVSVQLPEAAWTTTV